MSPVIPSGFNARVSPVTGALSAVEYRWDVDTDILTATLSARTSGDGASGSIEMEGADGSWVIFDVNAGHIAGVEVAVWPEVRKLGKLVPPADAESGQVAIPLGKGTPGVAALEVDTHLAADADAGETTIHFRFGAARPARYVRIAQDLILDIDDRKRIAGVWLLNVPPFPGNP